MLFSMNDVPDAAAVPTSDPLAITNTLPGTEVFINRNQSLVEALPALEADHSYNFWSDGKWHLHELMFHVLSFTGPAEITLATWSIKELPMRLMVQARTAGTITGLRCLVDKRVKYQNPDVWAMGQLNFDKLAEGNVHAKVTVIRNNKWNVCIIGSANYTNNPREEAGVIITSSASATFYHKMITDAIGRGNAC